MLHVNAAEAIADAKPAFDPIAYIAHCRAAGAPVTAYEHDGKRSLSWDISNLHKVDQSVRTLPDPRLDIDAGPECAERVFEVLRAQEWIATARRCGLLVFPFHGLKGAHVVGQTGSASRDYGEASEFFLDEPAIAYDETSDQRQTIFAVLCAEMNLDIDDPALPEKVNAIMEKEHPL